MTADTKQIQDYREAYGSWQEQLKEFHRVLLDGAPLDSPKLKGLLNREARAKERYDAARLALPGLDADHNLFAKVS